MAGFIELIAKIKPKNNGKYPLVDDVDVEMEDGSRLSEAIKKPRIPDGGTKGQILAKKSNTNGDAEWVEPLKTEDIDKKLESKLDKNLGSENSDKVLITDAEGNIITQNKEDFEGSGGTTSYNDLENKPQINGVELKGNKTSSDLKMYTQEEVDDLLYDKMDKPYKPITITDDITIEDCLDGRFKINKILGNTYQAEESDIVPTPQRPIPINSRKTTITKINPNIFDLEKESDTSSIPDTGTYRSIGQYQLKANTKYIFEWTEATVPAKATLSFQIQDDKGTVLVSPFTYFNLQTDEKKEAGKEVEFTTNSSGIVKFAYNCVVGTSSTTETYQQYWYTKILKDIVLKEDVEYVSERVELRSLKETINKFDLGLLSQTNLITNSGAYRKIEIPIKLKPNTRYKIYYEKSMFPALTWAVLNIVDNTEEELIAILNVKNTENNEVEKQAINLAFTSPNDGEIYFSYYVQSYNTEGVLVSQTTETFKEKWFTKILKNIMITEESLNQNTYVAPTVRDYKIVDHTTQTSKIVRNVGIANLTNLTWTYGSKDLNHIRVYAVLPQPLKFVEQYCYCNVFECNYSGKYDYSKEAIYLGNNMGGKTISIMANKDVFAGHTQEQFDRLLKEYINNPNAITLYALETPTEETIAYSADDVSEVGYSWQDTTSPSPTIPAEVKGVEKIDILKTGKNLLNEALLKNADDYDKTLHSQGFWEYILYLKPNTKYTISRENTIGYQLGYHIKVDTIRNNHNSSTWFVASHANNENKQAITITTNEDGIVVLYFNNTIERIKKCLETIGYLQLELGDTATSYEPYQEQHINITPPQPLYKNDIANVESGDYEYEKQKYVVTGDEVFYQDYQAQLGYYGRYFILNNSISYDDITTSKCYCNMLQHMPYSWIVGKESFCQNINKQIHIKFSNDRLGITDNTPLEEKRLAFANYLKQLYASEEPLYVVVKVAKTTQPIPEEDLAKLKSLKTNAGVNNIFINGEVKPTIEARYALDIASIVSKLQTKLLTLQEEVIKNV